jgi:hypothetical protein
LREGAIGFVVSIFGGIPMDTRVGKAIGIGLIAIGMGNLIRLTVTYRSELMADFQFKAQAVQERFK